MRVRDGLKKCDRRTHIRTHGKKERDIISAQAHCRRGGRRGGLVINLYFPGITAEKGGTWSAVPRLC